MRTPFLASLRVLGRALLLPVLLLLAALPASAQITNGGFEDPYAAPTINGWTKTRWTNLGLIVPPSGPFTGASIQKGSGGVDLTRIVTAGIDPWTNPTHPLSMVRFGNQAVVVNENGNNHNGNSLTQTVTVTPAFLDADGKYHIRFAYAPVLESGGHSPFEQPFFYVGVTDTTTNAILYDSVNYSEQAGITWFTAGGWYWTDWQVVDLALDASSLGHSILLEFSAAGCMYTAHAGHLYVDGVAPKITDLWITGSGPATVSAGGTITYTYIVRNDSPSTTYNNVTVSLTPPSDNQSPVHPTTFASSTLPGGGTTANIGSLAPGASATYTMTVNVPVAAAGQITHGDYYVSATGYPAIAGPAIKTVVNGPPTDLGSTVTPSVAGYHQISYLVTTTNNGPNLATAAQTSFALPPGSTFVSALGGVGVLVTGSGPVLAQFGDLPNGASRTFTVVVSMPGGTAAGTPVTGTATASGAFTNTNPAGGVSTGTFTWLADLSITSHPASANYLRNTPASPLTVGTAGGWGSLTYTWYRGLSGDTTTPVGNGATYTPPTTTDGTYNYWVRVCDAGTCVDSNAATIFVYFTHNITATAGPGGTISPSGVVAVTHGNNQLFTVTANSCYHIADVLVDGVSQGPFGTNTFTTSYTFNNVTTDHTISATFSINTYALSYTAGPNGYLSGTLLQVVNCGSSGTPVLASGLPGSTYRFWRWSDGSIQNPRTDTNVAANLSVTAIFATIEEEPNDNFVTATPVSGPGLCVGRINPANGLAIDPSDYYRVILPQGATLTAVLTPPPGTRYYIYLYNQMGRIVAQGANSVSFRHPGVGAQYYYPVVRTVTYGASNPAYYQLNLNWSPVINPGGAPN